MIDVKTQNIYEQLTVPSQRAFPAAPFPRKYVHSVFDDPQDAVQAVQALQAAGYDAGDIHFMASGDFVAAIEPRYQQRSGLMQTLMHFLIDYGFDDVYLREARQGRHILAVRLGRCEQLEPVRDLLAPHHAHH
ncbi:MAG TPA: hypothetical protein VFK47_00090, partial [Ktedonobacteraceae bacterium]|nr:hypothetical protein [Ktedonobacteraceae bacterium]